MSGREAVVRALVSGLTLWGAACAPAPAPPAGDSSSASDTDGAEGRVDTDTVSGSGDGDVFTLTSDAFVQGGTLPVEFTCDGEGHSPPLAWTGAPDGTVGFAVLMTTTARDGLKWNWVLYDLGAGVGSIPVGGDGGGTAGLTSDGPALAYSPPCSQGPGAKTYTFTVYALSATPTLPANARDVTGAVLTDAVADLTLRDAHVDVTYTR